MTTIVTPVTSRAGPRSVAFLPHRQSSSEDRGEALFLQEGLDVTLCGHCHALCDIDQLEQRSGKHTAIAESVHPVISDRCLPIDMGAQLRASQQALAAWPEPQGLPHFLQPDLRHASGAMVGLGFHQEVCHLVEVPFSATPGITSSRAL